MSLGLGNRLDEFRVGMMMLTRLPMGRVARTVPLARTVWSWPLAGVAVGLAFGGAAGLARWAGLADSVAISLAMAMSLLVSGGLHEDGLADLADSAGAGGDRQRRLEIMRDSRIGSYGALALACLFLTAFHAWAALPAGEITAAAVMTGALSRMALPLWLWRMPPARSDGLGKAAAAGLELFPCLAAMLVGLACAMAAAPPPSVLTSALACLTVQALVMLYARKTLGGVTGDVLGAAQVLGALAALVALGAG